MWILFVICPKSTEKEEKVNNKIDTKISVYLLKAPCQELSASWGSGGVGVDVTLLENKSSTTTGAILSTLDTGPGKSRAPLSNSH